MNIGDYVRHTESGELYEVVKKFGPWPVLKPLKKGYHIHVPPDMEKYFEVLGPLDRRALQ